jgi:hypothetical protein
VPSSTASSTSPHAKLKGFQQSISVPIYAGRLVFRCFDLIHSVTHAFVH